MSRKLRQSIFTRYAVVDAGRDLAAGTERLAALGNRHTIGTLEGSDHKDGVPAEARTPFLQIVMWNSGGGTRTPDTRIMIPLL